MFFAWLDLGYPNAIIDDPIPGYLQVCIDTFIKYNNDDFNIVVINRDNIKDYIKAPLHPAFNYLLPAHRADYLRAAVLRENGGCYFDVDAICTRPFIDIYEKSLERFELSGYCGKQWGEVIGMSAMHARENSNIVNQWYSEMIQVLDDHKEKILETRSDTIGWTGMLRNVLLPISRKHESRVGCGYNVYVPNSRKVWKSRKKVPVYREKCMKILRDETYPIWILNNHFYGNKIRHISRESILSDKNDRVLFEVLRGVIV